ncbi:MAG TPA: hypothetical protein DD621_01270 [Clostridiales bacterium]|nr:hypothetical protein [Clostridiales bacterium]
MDRRWKRIILITVGVLILLVIVGIFYVVIVNTANLNSQINITANDCLGSVTINITNAENGTPYSYFDYEYTTKGDKKHKFENKNLLFRSDTESITIEFVVDNKAFYNTYLHFDNKGPGRNGKVVFRIDGVEQEQTTDIVIPPLTEMRISYEISKNSPALPIRAKYKMNLSITKTNPLEQTA